jgi:hypothetical protein
MWEALRDQLPDDAALFYSVNLLARDREHEIDLLVAWPGVGYAAIEVKGGYVTRDADGWHQGSGANRRRIDPVRQAQDGRHELTRYLSSHRADAARARAAHLVALPATTIPRDWDSPECPRSMVIDHHDVARAAEVVRRAIEEHGKGAVPLTDGGLEGLIETLVSALPSQSEQLARAAEHEQRVDQMTRDQASILEKLRHHRRLKIIGGAGSGKTWLALEQARRLVRAGERVALVCYSRGLGRYFERIVETWPARERPAYVGLFHHLPVTWGAETGADDDSDYWERRLPIRLGELAAARANADLFDAVVVDEAQDFSDLWWPSLLACLRDPVGGGLFVFLDDSQRVFAREGHVPIDLAPVVLAENIRNTKPIAQLFGSLSGEPMNPRGLAGAPVRLVDVAPEAAIGAADDAVEALLGEGWQPGQIALLTTWNRHPEQRNAVDLGGWATYWDAFFAEDDVFYGHVLGFKGLERPVVVLAVNGFRAGERAREMLYVGLSRARSLLVVAGPRELVAQIGGGGVRKRLERAVPWTPGS